MIHEAVGLVVPPRRAALRASDQRSLRPDLPARAIWEALAKLR